MSILKKFLYTSGGKIVKAYTKLMYRMSVNAFPSIPRGGKILVANHPTTTDPFILTSISNGQAAVLIHNTLFNVPVFGRYLHMSGHIPVVDGKGAEAFEKALKLLKKDITVIVFIEGGLSKFIHQVGKAKTGAVRLALASQKPIIPIGISVKRKNVKTIRSTIKGIQEWGKWYFRGPYAITIGKALNLRGNIDNRNQVENLSSWLRNKISLLEKESAKRLNLRK